MKWDFSKRFGFLVRDVERIWGDLFDRMARERIGLSRAQCRLLGALAMHGDDQPLSQTELARHLGLSAMTVGGLCDRMAAAGWIQRQASSTDRRANEVRMAPQAQAALGEALRIGDSLNARALATLSSAERAQLLALLTQAHTNLVALADNPASAQADR